MGISTESLLPAWIRTVHWYFTKEVWPYILTFVNTWKNMGYYTVIYMAAIIGIDDEYYEAATIDGASKFNRLRYYDSIDHADHDDLDVASSRSYLQC